MDKKTSRIFRTVGWPLIAVMALYALAFAHAPLFGQSATTVVPIEKMQIGSAPDDFDIWRTGQGEPALWGIIYDQTAAGGRAMEQLITGKTSYRFPLAVFTPISAVNVDVSIRFKPIAGEIDQAGGVAIRLVTSDDYYVVRANALEDNVRFYKVIGGKREQLASADVAMLRNEWHELQIKAEGNRFTIVFNGKLLFTVHDQALTESGKIAL